MERKEAIEIVRKLYNESLFLKKDKEAMVTLIPELAESEDERIRKDIISLVIKWWKDDGEVESKFSSKKSMLDWLEKRGESTDIPADAVLDGNKDGLIADTVRRKREKQGEQKPYGQREECSNFQMNYAGQCKGSCAMKRGEQKPAWSEEDELMLVSIIQTLKLTNGAAQMKIDWLNAVKCRIGSKVNCTTARKWSGEDEELCEHLIKSIEELDPLPTSIYSDCKKWLKILKDRYSWMPSEEQVMALEAMLTVSPQSPAIQSVLIELYKQLKKLREE